MPLVLTLREGQDFYVGQERFVIADVFSEAHFRVRRESTGQTFEVVDTRATEVMEDVFIAAGERPSSVMARVSIDAPQSMLVLRGDKKRAPPDHVNRRSNRGRFA